MIQAIGATPEKSLARASQKWQRSQMKKLRSSSSSSS
jgi:hypothetical protein